MTNNAYLIIKYADFPDFGVLQPITMQHGVELVLGRGPLTKVKLPSLSREQLHCIADLQQGKISLTQVWSGRMGHT